MSHPLVATVPPRTAYSRLTDEERARLKDRYAEEDSGALVSLGSEGGYWRVPVRYD